MQGENFVTALLVEDKAWLRELFKPTLAALGCDVVGEAGTHKNAVELFDQHRPNIVLTNEALAMGSGMDVLRDILAIDNSARVIMLTTHTDDATRETCLNLGASGFIVKNRPIEEFVETLRSHLSTVNAAA